MKPLLPQELFKELGRAVSEEDLVNAIVKLETFIEESKQINELEDLQFTEIQEKTNRLVAIREGQKPTYSTFKYEKKK